MFKKKRPQEPKRPFPYIEKEVKFTNSADGMVLKGTLTIPDDKKQYPAVILVTGSGAQNRDEEILGHKPFLVIADHLTKAGIAVLRYDDRHFKMPIKKGWSYTTKDFANDAKAAVDFLEMQENIDSSFIGIAGHSEGGVVAPMVASMDSRVAFIITLAGTGLSGREIAVKQNQYFSENKKDAAFAKIAHEIILNEPDFLLRKKKIWQAVNDFYGRFNLLMKIQFLFAMNITASEWNRFFIMYDPAEALEKVTCPVLALNGEYDIQVLPQDNLAAIEEALKKAKNTDYTTMVIPKANHLFQIVESGGPKPYSKLVKEYATTEQTITPEVLEIMTEWIIKRYLIAKK
jgi:hypothetical protein